MAYTRLSDANEINERYECNILPDCVKEKSTGEMCIKKDVLKLNLKRLLAGLLAAGTALIFCACELSGNEIPLDTKDSSTYHAHIKTPVDIPEEKPEEKPDPGYQETYESSMMNFVVPNDFEVLKYFSREDFESANPEATYSDEELFKASEAFLAYLDELAETGWQVKFNYFYINNDNLPELVYVVYSGEISLSSSIEFHFCTFDFDKDEVIEIGSYYTQHGADLYYAEKENILWFNEWNMSESFLKNYYVTINKDNKFELVASFEKNISSSDPDSPATVNHIDTDYSTLLEYQDCFNYLIKYRKDLDINAINTMIPLNGNFEFVIDEYTGEIYNKEYDDDCIEAAYEAYAEALSRKTEEAEYSFIYLDGDNIPEMFLLSNDKYYVYKASIYKDENSDISKYVYEVTDSEFEGQLSYAAYNRAISASLKEDGNSIVNYAIYNFYNCHPMQKYTATPDGKYYINDFPVPKDRFEDIIGKWIDFSFTEVTESDFTSNKKASNVKKVFYETVKKYNP